MTRLARAVAVLVAATCGVYTLVYLYRWEWHRAIVAGMFLVVAEVALATAVLLRRLAALDRRLTEVVEAGARPGPQPEILVHLRESAPEPRPPFAWLEPDRLGVFLPILLGAGVLASAAAWVVEALARKTARPGLERRLAARLEVFALPAAGLLDPGPAGRPVRRARRAPAWAARLGLMALAVFGGAVGIDELADATQTRPDAVRAGVHTVVELELHGELAQADPARMAASLWHTCEGALRRDLPEPVVTVLGGARVQLALPLDIGTHTLRRLHGCLEDAAFDRVQAGVVVRMVSAPG